MYYILKCNSGQPFKDKKIFYFYAMQVKQQSLHKYYSLFLTDKTNPHIHNRNYYACKCYYLRKKQIWMINDMYRF